MFVCTKPTLSKMIRPIVPTSSQIIFIDNKWVGGTLTNWDEIIKYITDITTTREVNKLKKSKYKRFYKLFTPFLRVVQKRDQKKSNIPAPDLMVLFHSSDQVFAVREAKRMRTPIVSIVDTNADPTEID